MRSNRIESAIFTPSALVCCRVEVNAIRPAFHPESERVFI